MLSTSPRVPSVRPTCLAALHAQIVCYVCQQWAPSRHAGSQPILLGSGAHAAPHGDVIFVKLQQLGRNVGLRLAERVLFLHSQLRARPHDPDDVKRLLEWLWLEAELGHAPATEIVAQRDAGGATTVIRIEDRGFLFTRHLDLSRPVTGDPRHVMRASSVHDDSAAGTAATAPTPTADGASSAPTAANFNPRTDDYLTFVAGMIGGFVECLGFAPQYSDDGRRSAASTLEAARGARPYAHVSAKVQPERSSVVVLVTLTNPQVTSP